MVDGDEGAAEIYDISDEVEAFVDTDIARAIVDVNRREDDRKPDGVVKTRTIWNVRIYREPLDEEVIERLLSGYYRPYHRSLSSLASGGVRLGIDCHTMVAEAPPIAADAGRPRPALCLSNADVTCPEEWIKGLAGCLKKAFGHEVKMNFPFKGGYIIRAHCSELPWIQLEISRGLLMSTVEKRERLLQALGEWCGSML
jgi:formiminoglutamase